MPSERPFLGAKRFAGSTGTILVLQDATVFNFKRERFEVIGFTKSLGRGNREDGRKRVHSICGRRVATRVAVIKFFWCRKKFTVARPLRTKINLTLVPIEKKESVL